MPGGAVPLGEALELADARPPGVVDVPAFVARRLPVTFARVPRVRRRGRRLEEHVAAHRHRRAAVASARAARGARPRSSSIRACRCAASRRRRGRVRGVARGAGRHAVAPADRRSSGRRPARGTDGRLYPWGDALRRDVLQDARLPAGPGAGPSRSARSRSTCARTASCDLARRRRRLVHARSAAHGSARAARSRIARRRVV